MDADGRNENIIINKEIRIFDIEFGDHSLDYGKERVSINLF